ncbi:MAG: PAS domain-containing protein [Opitutaceae bacterium]|nr:PAS domain-containing protein [Opitutaceae bacterium]
MEPASTPAQPAAPAASRDAAGDFCAAFVLGADGRIAAASASAQDFWQTGEGGMIGEAFVALFAWEVVSAEPDFLGAQWDALLASAQRGIVEVDAQPREGEPRPVRVRIEPALGAAGGAWLATVRRPAAPAAAANDTLAAARLLDAGGAIGFFELDWSTHAARFSPAWKKVLGYAPGEIPATVAAWQELIHADDSAASPARAGRRPRAGTRQFSGEFRMRHQRGHWVWVHCAGVQQIAETGAVERFAGLHFDITDRRELEDSLAASDARLQDLSGGGPLAAFEIDFAQGTAWFSAAWERLLGYTDGELPATAESFAAALACGHEPEDAAAWLLSHAPGTGTFSDTAVLRAKDGRPVPVILGAHRTTGRKGDLLRAVGFACALPVGIREEGALPAALTLETFAAIGEGVLVSDAAGKIRFANAHAARLLGADATALPGRDVSEVFHLIHRETGRPGDDAFERAVSSDRPLTLVADHALAPVSASTRAVPIVWSARVARDGHGRPLGAAIAFRDPEEMSLTPDERAHANRLESLALLAGGIAHDFNNLLTTILGAICLARDNHDYSGLAAAEQSCETAKGLTKQLLTFAKGGGSARTVCGARALLEDALKIASAGSTAEIALQVDESTEPVLVDRPQLLQVFQNLVINAVQAMPPPPHRPRLHLRAGNTTLGEQQVPGLGAGAYVEFEIRDNGSGIAPEHVAKIFDPFFTTKKHGTGLGLATVLAIVRRHGGQIGLDTQPGAGTAFTVYLPRATDPEETAARRAPSLRFGTGRILLMDDDPKISELTAAMLGGLDYKYDLARKGEEAVALYQRYLNIGRPYDAVILDLTVIGGMGGEECFKALRKIDPEVRAIVASGYDHDDYARKFLDMGFCGYLPKPYRIAELGKILKTVIGGG